MATDGEAIEQRLTLLGIISATADQDMAVARHIRAIHEWYEEAKAELADTEIDPAEIWFDVVSSYIGAEVGKETDQMAQAIRRQLEI